ncbi:MAG TPA: glycosyltransferase [Solirubrobacteraceae bacterium]|jgi:glycosyltransferase involved in cell wall biosynthesis|nr:glycosyltransferase [Solirubrobacteraceae bacterium]
MSASPIIDVSVLVPVLNEAAAIREAVEAMAAQEFDGSVEFIFADGNSSDGSREQLESLALADPRLRVLDNPRRGTASGLNVCLRAARGRYAARMDAHALYPRRYLQTGVERLERGDVAWVAGPQVPVSRGRVSAAIVAALGTWLGRGSSKRWSGGGPGAQANAGADPFAGEYELDTGVFCGVWRRDDLIAKGGWDEGWPRNQDSELAARFLEAGERIVCVPAMAAEYLPRESLAALWRQYRAYGSYRVKTAGRHPSSLRRSAVLPPLLVLDVLAAILAPRPLRRAARLGVLAYALALASSAREAGGEGGPDPLVPAVLATMHAGHGAGFLEGCVRWGVPWRALKGLLGETMEEPYTGPIDAPSLTGPPAS